MEFEARKLRVQIPCGDGTIIDCVLGTCRLPTVFTCLWQSPIWTDCRYSTRICLWPTLCPFGSDIPIACEIGTGPRITRTVSLACDPGEIELDDLPVLIQQLEGQLKLANDALEIANKQRKSMK
jgi:hypothetical protein